MDIIPVMNLIPNSRQHRLLRFWELMLLNTGFPGGTESYVPHVNCLPVKNTLLFLPEDWFHQAV